jgi:hypothetical protein
MEPLLHVGRFASIVRPVRRVVPLSILPYGDVVLAVFPVAWVFGRMGCHRRARSPGAESERGGATVGCIRSGARRIVRLLPAAPRQRPSLRLGVARDAVRCARFTRFCCNLEEATARRLVRRRASHRLRTGQVRTRFSPPRRLRGRRSSLRRADACAMGLYRAAAGRALPLLTHRSSCSGGRARIARGRGSRDSFWHTGLERFRVTREARCRSTRPSC